MCRRPIIHPTPPTWSRVRDPPGASLLQESHDLFGIEWPVHCRGPLELGAKACRVDKEGLGQVAAKLAANEVRNKLDEKIEEKLGDKVSPELKDALKGLFKR